MSVGIVHAESAVFYRNETVTITTTPIPHRQKTLRISADVKPQGYVKVRLLNRRRELLAESAPLQGHLTDRKLSWPSGFSFNQLGSDPVHIQFEIQDATVYSFSFAE